MQKTHLMVARRAWLIFLYWTEPVATSIGTTTTTVGLRRCLLGSSRGHF